MGVRLAKRTLAALFFTIALLVLPNAYSAVFINEVLVNGANDPDTEWVELFNSGSMLNITNWKISETSSGNFTFNATFPSNGFVVLAGDLGTFLAAYPGANLSAKVINITISNFNLADTTGKITLFDNNGNIADELEYVQASGKEFENVSIARYPDGSQSTFNLSTLTPGKRNDRNAPSLNKWINPSGNNTRISGLVNVTINITDDASEVESAAINFNGTAFQMVKNSQIWSFLWNTSPNFGKTYNITLSFNDSYGKSGFDKLFNITVDNKPFITSFSPQNLTQRMFENSTLVFSVNASDPDDAILDISWLVDNLPTGTSTSIFHYKPDFGDNGTHFINATIRDASSNQVSIKWTVAVLKVNRAPVLGSIGDKTASKSLTLEFNITAADPEKDSLEFSSNHSAIVISKFNDSSATVSWKPKNTDLGNNLINFTVNDGFAADSEIIKIFVGFLNNSAPVITSSPITFATSKEQYTYDAEVFDSDNDTIFFSLKSNASDISIDKFSGLVTFNPSSAGFFSVNVTATDLISITDQSFSITVLPGNKLRIDDVDVEVDNKKRNNLRNNSVIGEAAKPGSQLEFKVTIKNDFSNDEDVKIEDISVNLRIEDIDEGNDLEAESNKFNLGTQNDKELKFEFSLPLNIDEGNFDVLIEAEGEDDAGKEYKQFFRLKLEVEKEKHDLRFAEFRISPNLIECQKSLQANYEIMNLGQEDEEGASIEVTSDVLGLLNKQENINIDSGTEDNIFSDSLRISLGNLKEGQYTIYADSYSDDGKLQDNKQATLTVKSCLKTIASKEPVLLTLGKDLSEEKPAATAETSDNRTMVLLLTSTLIFTLFFVFTAMIVAVKR